MTDRDPLASFDEEVLTAVASECDVPRDRLEALTRRHQESIRALPGVDDIVYEWRNRLRDDPLVHRSAKTYVLEIPDHVWQEFVDALEWDDREASAVRALHNSQARQLVDSHGTSNGDAIGDDAMVLSRP